MASAIGHGLFTRFPRLKIAPIENGSHWVRPLLEASSRPTKYAPQLFDEHPVDVFKRNVWVHPFHEEDPVGLVDAASAPTTCCSAPTTRTRKVSPTRSRYVDELSALPSADDAKVMGGNLGRLMKTPAQKAA